jgi:hypothetical protein
MVGTMEVILTGCRANGDMTFEIGWRLASIGWHLIGVDLRFIGVDSR